MKTILDLCGGTGSWSKPYADAGYVVTVVDPVAAGGDVRDYLYGGRVHGILAAPPCTVFASSGARWPRSSDDMRQALAVVDACLRVVVVSRPFWWALENPVGKLSRWLGPPAMRFNPCDFGDAYTKRTCLWGEFKRPMPDPVFAAQGSRMHTQYGGKSERTKRERSKTPAGFAQSFFEANP